MSTRPAATLAKGLKLLSALVADEGRSSLSAVAKDLQLPLPTAHRLALALAAAEFLEQRSKGHFLVGKELAKIALTYGTPTRRIAAWLRPALERTARTFGVLMHFGVLEDGMVTYIVKENGGRKSLFTAEQQQLEAYCSAIGKVLLAALPSDQLDAYLANGPFVALTSQTLTDPDDIRRELAVVRRAGVAFDRFEIREDLYCIAIAVPDDEGKTAGAISASFLGDLPEPRVLEKIRREMQRIAAYPVQGRQAHSIPANPIPSCPKDPVRA